MGRSSSPVIQLFFRLFWAALLGLGSAAFGCSGSSGSTPAAVTFDACAPLALVPEATATPAELTGIAAAAALWNGSAQTVLAMTTSSTTIDDVGAAAPPLLIHFQAAAAPFHGLYDGAAGEVFVNDDLSAAELPIVIAHEIGHAFGLVHVSPDIRLSLMNPDNLDVAPTNMDVMTLGDLWGRCGLLDAAAPLEIP